VAGHATTSAGVAVVPAAGVLVIPAPSVRVGKSAPLPAPGTANGADRTEVYARARATVPVSESPMEYDGDRLVIEKESLSNLDELVLSFVEVLDDEGVEYVLVAGYAAILLGRSRATEDVDVIIERLDEPRADALADALVEAGFWGVEESLDAMFDRFSEEPATRVAPRGEAIPNFEVKPPRTDYDRRSLRDAVDAEFAGHEVRISPLELQVAFKLYLGSQTDFEDAALSRTRRKPRYGPARIVHRRTGRDRRI
jgi:hypothetical protein